MPSSGNPATRRSGTSKDGHAADAKLIALLHSHPVNPQFRNDVFLVLACDLFQDRVAVFATVIGHLAAAGNTQHDELRRRADELRMEWQAIARAVVTTPAAHSAGRQAKAGALHALYKHVGTSEGIDADLARSLVGDLVDPGDG